MSEAEPPSPRREACLRAALRAYPAVDRREYGGDLLDAAADLAASGSTVKEVAGLLRGGLQARLRRSTAGLVAVDRRAAGDALVEPLTAMAVAVWGGAAMARLTGEVGVKAGAAPGLTVGAVLLLAVLSVLVIAVSRRQRSLATGAALVLLAQVAISAGWLQWRGGIVTAAPPVHLYVGTWWFGPSLVWSLIPFVALLAGSCWVMTPAAPRLQGLSRVPREWPAVRLVAMLTPAAVLAAVLLLEPRVLFHETSAETTEIPGLLFLMLVVAAFWLATSSPAGRDHWAAAAALLGLAAVPSVAYGFADFITPALADIAAPTVRLGLVLLLSSLLVAACVSVFVAALSSVGLRTDAGAPPHGLTD